MTETGFYQRGINNRIFTTFINLNGAVPSSIGSIAIQITDEVGATDVPITSMVQFGTTNHYYYDWTINGSATLGNHLVQYSYLVDGVLGSSGEVVSIVDVVTPSQVGGGGADWVSQDIAMNLKKMADNITTKRDYVDLKESLGSIVDAVTGNINKKITKNNKEIDDLKETNNKLVTHISKYSDEVKELVKGINIPEVDLEPIIKKVELNNDKILKVLNEQKTSITTFSDSNKETINTTLNNLSADFNKMVLGLSDKVGIVKDDLLNKNEEANKLVISKLTDMTNNINSYVDKKVDNIPLSFSEYSTRFNELVSGIYDKLEEHKKSIIVKNDEDLTKMTKVFDENCQITLRDINKVLDKIDLSDKNYMLTSSTLSDNDKKLYNKLSEFDELSNKFAELDSKLSLFSVNTLSGLSNKATKEDIDSTRESITKEVNYSQNELMSQYVKVVDRVNKLHEKLSNELSIQKSIMEDNTKKIRKQFSESNNESNINSQLNYLKGLKQEKNELEQ